PFWRCCRWRDGAPSKANGGVALPAPAGSFSPPGRGGRSPPWPWPPPRSNFEGETPSRGPYGRGLPAGRIRAPGRASPAGAGDIRPAPSPGRAVAPGRGRAPDVPLPRSNGDPPNEGASVAPGAMRPALPRGPGVAAGARLAPAGLVPPAGAGLLASRAAARV